MWNRERTKPIYTKTEYVNTETGEIIYKEEADKYTYKTIKTETNKYYDERTRQTVITTTKYIENARERDYQLKLF